MLYVEIAETPDQLRTGLMFRTALSPQSGMLFKFSNPQILNFWGFNTYLPLDIAFINDKNIIVKIDRIKPLSKTAISSDEKCIMAIETNEGFFVENNITLGDKIELDKDNISHIVLFKKDKG